MASSVSNLKLPPIHLHRRNPFSLLLPLSTLSFPSSSHWFPSRALKTQSAAGGIRSGVGDGYSSSADVLRKPVVVPEEDPSGDSEDEDEAENEEVRVEDKILEDTVPLVGFARMVLHSGKYESGERLSPQHEKVILERFLPYHPECEMKIGRGVDYITVSFYLSLSSVYWVPSRFSILPMFVHSPEGWGGDRFFLLEMHKGLGQKKVSTSCERLYSQAFPMA